jgi:predicted small lipoprotein YifL
MKNLTRVSAALLLSMFLLGCGQTGPLYVSGNPSSVQAPTGGVNAENEEEQDAESSKSE